MTTKPKAIAIVTGINVVETRVQKPLEVMGARLSARNKSKRPVWTFELTAAEALWPLEGLKSRYLYARRDLRKRGLSLRIEPRLHQ